MQIVRLISPKAAPFALPPHLSTFPHAQVESSEYTQLRITVTNLAERESDTMTLALLFRGRVDP
jgi:hypothetical protein